MAEWYEGLDADTLAHATTKGWNALKPEEAAVAAIKAHAGAEKLIGHPADQVLKLPKDAADPAFQAVYDRVAGMVTPKTPEEYKFGEGTKEEDAAFVRKIAVEQKLSIPAATAIANELATRNAASAANNEAATATTKAANQAHLMAAWGADYDRKSFSATNAAQAAGLPASILQHIATLPAEEYRKGMDALVALGEKMGEAAMLRGGGVQTSNPTAGMTPADARARLSALGEDKVWGTKFRAGDVEARTLWTQLCTIVASGNVAAR